MANIFEKNKTYLGDCLELMPQMEAGMFDMILCDLPYGTTENKWDSIIDINKLWQQYERIIKPSGAILLTASQPFTTTLVASNLKLFKYELIWVKSRPSGHLEAKNKPMRKHENILIFSKGASSNGCKNRITYNPQGLVKVERYNKNSTDTQNYCSRKNRPIGLVVKQEYTNYPNSILEIASKGKTIHPTQKPIELFEYLIKTYTNEGELILDNCAGSGTTGEACFNTGRNYIQIEKEQKYFDLILGREKSFNKKDLYDGTLFETQM